MLGLMVFLSYQVAVGNVNLRVGSYRGEYNSAWVGSMMSIIASFFLSWLGFYLVKGSVARDSANSGRWADHGNHATNVPNLYTGKMGQQLWGARLHGNLSCDW